MKLVAVEAEKIHADHLELLEKLNQLERGLHHLVCYSEVFADLSGAQEVRFYGHKLLGQLADHFRREEKTIFEPVSEVSPEVGGFCNEMRTEHGALLLRASLFERALAELDSGADLYDAVSHLKSEGKQLTESLRLHMAREESELSGFL